MKASDLLFHEPTPDKQPLFQNPTSLARFLREHELSDKAAHSLSAFLNQILCHEERRCPDELVRVLVQAVHIRLTDAPEQTRERWKDQLEKALRTISGRKSGRREQNLYTITDDHISALEDSGEVCTISSVPLECHPCSYASSLQEIILRKLGLGSGLSIKTPPPFRYTLYLSCTEACQEWVDQTIFWILQDAARHICPFERTDALEKLAALETIGQLRVYLLSPSLCAVPTIVLNPRNQDIQAYNIHFHTHEGTSNVHIARFDQSSLEYWRRTIFIPLEVGHIPRQRVPLHEGK